MTVFTSNISETNLNGNITLNHLTVHTGGVKVTGGTEADFTITKGATYNNLSLIADRGENLAVNIGYRVSNTNSYTLACTTGQGNYRYIHGIQASVSGNSYTGVDGSTRVFYANAGSTYGHTTELFSTTSIASSATVGNFTYGFRSGLHINNDASKQLYNFFAAGNAPNFFKGDTFIGGSDSRNTSELWKSTLTEEQLEQLTAGTLVIPANVSTPGDGSFVRQWWYDQQSAEDQALIDSGELAYPTHLAAATFTDTFALGDNTKINLYTNGVGQASVAWTSPVMYADQISGFLDQNNPGLPRNTSTLVFPRGTSSSSIQIDGVTGVIPDGTWATVAVTASQPTSSTIKDGYLFLGQTKENMAISSGFGFSVFGSAINDPVASDTIVASFRAQNIAAGNGTTVGAGINAGFYGQLNTLNTRNYNFYASGNAPNFLQGDTYIGGGVSRNTFGLWKSTLTEEQLEELTAGTLVAPANVSTPGDGSFARQWYYDQQDAETQAELDAGTLEYPTHLAAATFTDTFALGDNTNIDLYSDGYVQASWALASPVVYTDTITGFLDRRNPSLPRNASTLVFPQGTASSSVQVKGITGAIPDATWATISVTATQPMSTAIRDGYLFLGQTSENMAISTGYGFNVFGSAVNHPIACDAVVASFRAQNIATGNGATQGSGKNAAFYGQLNALNPRNYNVYAEGNAPNYFAGNIQCDGLINGTFGLRMQSDDPTAFTTTYSTDDDGNQVSNSVYQGTTEDLLSIIKDLRARVTTNEAVQADVDANEVSRKDVIEFESNLTRVKNSLRSTYINIGNNIELVPAAAGGRVEITGDLVLDASDLTDAADDTAAAAANVVVGGVYHNNGVLRVRLS